MSRIMTAQGRVFCELLAQANRMAHERSATLDMNAIGNVMLLAVGINVGASRAREWRRENKQTHDSCSKCGGENGSTYRMCETCRARNRERMLTRSKEYANPRHAKEELTC